MPAPGMKKRAAVLLITYGLVRELMSITARLIFYGTTFHGRSRALINGKRAY